MLSFAVAFSIAFLETGARGPVFVANPGLVALQEKCQLRF